MKSALPCPLPWDQTNSRKKKPTLTILTRKESLNVISAIQGFYIALHLAEFCHDYGNIVLPLKHWTTAWKFEIAAAMHLDVSPLVYL